MMLYQVPSISTIRQEPLQSHLQYQPNCFGDSCSENLGINGTSFCNGTDEGLDVAFFLPGRTDPNPPFGCIIVAENDNGVTQDGGSCNYFGPLSCAEGQVWEVDCSFPSDFFCSGFNQAFISCSGELSTVCSSGGD